jgi:pSer/pThr/pTyr-binding forkhead associated (FHA) protein
MSDLIYVKYCPACGAENPARTPFCLDCVSGDLSTAAIVVQMSDSLSASPEAATERRVSGPSIGYVPEGFADPLVLELISDPSQEFVAGDGQTVGRTSASDVVLANVPKSDFISSVHARFFTRGGEWYVQHLASTNFIKVDDERYTGDEEVAIIDGSVVVLSLTPFRVRCAS